MQKRGVRIYLVDFEKKFVYSGYMAEVTVEKTKDYLVVKIPLRSVSYGKAELSAKAQKTVDVAIAEGLADIKAGRVYGPFGSVKKFKNSLRKKKK